MKRPALTPINLAGAPRREAEAVPRFWNLVPKDGAVEIMLYSEIDSSGYWGVSAKQFAADLVPYASSDIRLRVNSPGGSVFDGVAIYNILLQHKGQVDVAVEGVAASAASFICMAGDTVTMRPASTMMIHDARAVAIGDAAVFRSTADTLDMLSDTIAGVYARRAGGDTETWRTRMRAETWINDTQAVELGLADAVAEIPGPPVDFDEPVASLAPPTAPPPEVPVETFVDALARAVRGRNIA